MAADAFHRDRRRDSGKTRHPVPKNVPSGHQGASLEPGRQEAKGGWVGGWVGGVFQLPDAARTIFWVAIILAENVF